jgi:hypothetical protein
MLRNPQPPKIYRYGTFTKRIKGWCRVTHYRDGLCEMCQESEHLLTKYREHPEEMEPDEIVQLVALNIHLVLYCVHTQGIYILFRERRRKEKNLWKTCV